MDEIGSQLREARMRLRIDTAEVERRTKIRAKYLRAMENEEWDLLPGDVYVRSFLRTYADFLGLDSRALLDEFRRRHESPSDHEPPPIAPPGRDRLERERRRQRSAVGIPSWAIVVSVLIVVGVALYFVGKLGDHHATPSAGVTHTTTGTRSGASHRRPRRHPRTVTHHAPAPTTVTVSLTPTSPTATWICLETATGRQLVDGTYAMGQTVPTGTAPKLLLTVASPSVTIKVNGTPLAVSTTAGQTTYRLTPSGHTVITAPTSNQTCGT